MMRDVLSVSRELILSMAERSNRQAELAIFGRAIEWDEEATMGTIRFGVKYEFPPIDVETLETLVEQEYLNQNDAHNYAPSVGTFLSWGRELETDFDLSSLFTGFMTAPTRSDSRIAINGIILESRSSLPQPAIDRTLDRFSPDLIEAEDAQLRLWWD